MKLYIFISLLVFSCLSSAANRDQYEKDIREGLQYAANELNKNLPKKIDSTTIAESVSQHGDSLIFSYSTTVYIDESTRGKLKTSLIKLVNRDWCKNEVFNNDIYPITIVFKYQGSNKSQAYFIFNKYDCY